MEKLYQDGERNFLNGDGSDNAFVINYHMAQLMNEEFGFVYRDRLQKLAYGITIYDSSVFATKKTRKPHSVVIHWYDHSWVKGEGFVNTLKKYVKRYFYFIYRK